MRLQDPLGGGRTSGGVRIGSVVVNCCDMELMTGFWSSLLDRDAGGEDDPDFRVLRGPGVNLSLQRTDSSSQQATAMHLDLYAADKSAAVRRALKLGARWVRASPDPDDDYEVLSDPEGNAFCIVQLPSAE